MANEIKIRHIRHLEEFEKLREAWGNLFSKQEIKTTFLTWEWLYAWWKTHLDNRELWLITAWTGSDLAGIAPLMLSTEKKHGLRFRLLQSLGSLNTDESDFFSRDGNPEIIQALINYIIQNKDQWDAITLHEHRADRASTKIIQDVFKKNNLVIRLKHNLHLHIPISGSWNVYIKSLSKNMTKNIKRRLRRTREIHELEFKHYKGQDVKWEHLETIFKINKNGAFPKKYESKSEREFHSELFNLMNSRDWIELAFLTLDKKPVAFEYGFNMNGRFEDWRTGYDQNFGNQAVAKSLLFLLLQELHNHGYKDFDFLRGEYDHKNDWQPLKNEFVGLTVVHPFHIPSRIALITIPNIWQQYKKHILPIIIIFRNQFLLGWHRIFTYKE